MPQKKSGHVTLSDVAQASGYAVSTVSIVLSEAPLSRNVASSTQKHIRSIAARLGYYPDAHARSLRKQSSGTVGVLTFDLADPYCMPIMRGIQSGLQATDRLPFVLDAHTERKLFDRYLSLLLERRVEGVIVVASWVFDETDLLGDMRKNSVPILIVGRDLTARGITSYLFNNEDGGRMAMAHLVSLGHRKIAVIRGPKEMFDSEPRWRGIQRAAKKHGVSIEPKLVAQLSGFGDSEHGFESGRVVAKDFVRTGRSFSAILAFDDMTALGVVRGLSECGLHVPKDCSVMGFDDVLPARISTPSMTTVSQPLREMGIEAAEWIVEKLDEPASSREKVKLFRASPKLVARASTASPPQPGD